MPQRDAPAVDVQAVVVIPVPRLQYGEDLRREGLVEFHQIHLFEREPGARHQLGHRRYGADAHRGWMTAGCGPTNQISEGLKPQGRELILGNDQAGGRGIVLLTGVAGRDGAAR